MSGAAPSIPLPASLDKHRQHLEAGLADHVWSIEELVELL
jgi:hypothetical protein